MAPSPRSCSVTGEPDLGLRRVVLDEAQFERQANLSALRLPMRMPVSSL
jgi:hypothetical protein